MNRRKRRGVSLGTVVMLVITAGVLAGFLALLPSFTGNQDIRVDAAKLAVAMDQSISQIAASTTQLLENKPQPASLPPEILATAVPAQHTPQTTAAPMPVVTPVPKRTFSLCAAGDILWDASVRKTLTIDDEYQFGILTDQIRGKLDADLSIASLPHTLSSDKLSDVNMPSEMLSSLASTGINTLLIGHRNILNAGFDGMTETRRSVRSAGMLPVGVYSSMEERQTVSLSQINGISVAILHYADEISSTGLRQTDDAQQSYAVALFDVENIKSDIAAARQAGAQVVIVSVRWGKNGASSPSSEQAEWAQEMADAGADIILGAGSEVLHPVRVLSADRGDGRYHPVLCAYSLGSLFNHDRDSRTTLASILLKTDVVYDTVNQAVAFENLTYTPTYAWRGKENKRILVRILLNDGITYPDFVASDQRKIMERCFKLVNDVMADTGIPMAQ